MATDSTISTGFDGAKYKRDFCREFYPEVVHTRVTRKPWFGPKRTLGWGWSPVSWEGWLACGVFLVLVLISVVLWQGAAGVIAVTVLVVALLLVTLLTGDPPG